MPLASKIITAPFRFGVEEGVDPKQVPFGTLTVCRDLVWVRSGRLQKRQGTTTLSTNISGGGTISSAQRLFTRGRQLCLISSNTLYSYTSSGWAIADNAGKISEVGLTWATSLDGYNGTMASDAGLTSDGKVIQAWVSGDPSLNTYGDLFYTITDKATGTVLTPVTAKSFGGDQPTKVRVLTSGTDWAIIFNVNGASNIRAIVNGAATVTLRSDAGSGRQFDAAVIGGLITIAYYATGNAIKIYSYTFATTPVQQASATMAGDSPTFVNAISIDGSSSDLLWIGYATDKFMVSTSNPTTLATVLNASVVEDVTILGDLTEPHIGVLRTSATTCMYLYGANGFMTGGYQQGMTASVVVSSAGALSATRKSWVMRPLTRPFLLGSRYYAYVGTWLTAYMFNGVTYTPGGETALIELPTTTASSSMPHRLVGHVQTEVGGNWRQGALANTMTYSSTDVRAVLPTIVENQPKMPLGIQQGTILVSATIGASLPTGMWSSVTLGPETYLAAGVLTAFDGRFAFDYGCFQLPYIDGATTTGIVGGSMANGTYLYSVVPEYRSAAGVLHRGPPATPQLFTIASGTTGKTTLVLAPVHLSQRLPESALDLRTSPMNLALYRSKVGLNILYRLTVNPSYNVVLQLPSSLTTAVDTRNDSGVGGGGTIALDTRPVLYTTGGEVADQQPPALTSLVLYRNRLFGIGGDELTVWFSKEFDASAGLAPGFSTSFRKVFSERVTALAVLDERLFFFHERGISYFSGDGPDLTGANDDYGEPNRLQSDIGCKHARALVSTPMGILFVAGDSSTTEIHLLNRKLDTEWVGKTVQGLLEQYPVITSAVLVANKNHVRFSANTSDGTSGIVLVYDYVESQWSHFAYAATAGVGKAVVDACLHDNVYTFVTSDGIVYKESDATCLDNGAFVPALLETAEYYADGPLSYQSVRNFHVDGVSVSAHGKNISVAFNGETTYQQGPRIFAEGIANVTAPGPVSTCRVSIGTRRKCRSVRFKMEETAPAVLGTGEGAIWSTMGIEVARKTGLGKLATTAEK